MSDGKKLLWRCALTVGLFCTASAACADQSYVAYVGTVTQAEGDEGTDASFGDPPQNAIPISAAEVSLCKESKCRSASDDAGAWGPIWVTFPLFDTVDIVLNVTAEGYEPFTYLAHYPKTEDPVYAEQLLNVRLRRLGPPVDAGAPDAEVRESGPGDATF